MTLTEVLRKLMRRVPDCHAHISISGYKVVNDYEKEVRLPEWVCLSCGMVNHEEVFDDNPWGLHSMTYWYQPATPRKPLFDLIWHRGKKGRWSLNPEDLPKLKAYQEAEAAKPPTQAEMAQ